MSERRTRPWQWGGGILLEQHKDPILSQELVQFIQEDQEIGRASCRERV